MTAIIGGIFGFLLAYAVIRGGLPGPLGAALMTFSGVASNFAGVPLALAFIFTLGRLGLVTLFLQVDRPRPGRHRLHDLLEARPRDRLPLLPVPADGPDHGARPSHGLKQEWREASENMGASSFQYWRHVALPILMPSLLGTMILLFGNAFGAQATAYQLTGGSSTS